MSNSRAFTVKVFCERDGSQIHIFLCYVFVHFDKIGMFREGVKAFRIFK